MHLTVLIPAKNEGNNIGETLRALDRELSLAALSYTLLVINDHSTDNTRQVLTDWQSSLSHLAFADNPRKTGFGNAVHYGLRLAKGDAVAIVMADGAEDPKDVVRCFEKMQKTGLDCVFGSRFQAGGQTFEYPLISLLINRLGNKLIGWWLRTPYDDFSNAFKIYRLSLIRHLLPVHSQGFGVTLELSIKAFKATRQIEVLPVKWFSRQKGRSKFSLVKNLPEYLKVVLCHAFR